MRSIGACALLAVIVSSSNLVRAEDSTDEPTETHEVKRSSSHAWYGYQTLLVDAVFIGVFASTWAWPRFDAATSLLVLDIVAFDAAAPLIHALHGNNEGAAVSIALRLLLPLSLMPLGVVIGLASPCSCGASDWLCLCGLSNAAVGGYVGTLVGGGLAAILDASFLAWEPRSPKAASVSWSVSPFALRGGAGLGAGCTF